MIKCRECKRKIKRGWYWYRTAGDPITGRRWLETYCEECAKSMVDEHTTNRLMVGYIKEQPRYHHMYRIEDIYGRMHIAQLIHLNPRFRGKVPEDKRDIWRLAGVPRRERYIEADKVTYWEEIDPD